MLARLRVPLVARSGSTWLWVVVATLIVWGLWAAAHGTAGPPTPRADQSGSDLQLYMAITARVAAGENYYRVLAEELPARHYPTSSVFNWRPPALTWLNSLPPSPYVGRVLFFIVGVAVIVLWLMIVKQRVPRMATASVPVLLLSSGPMLFLGTATYFAEIWSGVLIAASLGSWAIGGRAMAVVFGAAALAMREFAVPYVVIMAAIAWWESARRESAGWMLALVLFGLYWAWHALQVMAAMPPGALTDSWVRFGGWAFVVATAHTQVFLLMLSRQWIAALVVPVVWAGFWRWTDPVGRRLAWIVTGYYALFMVAGRPDNWYWGFMVAPLLPLGAFGHFLGSRRRRAR